MEIFVRKHLKYNFLVNLLDGAYFGLGMGFGSFGTVVTLFVSRMTDSALLIGLVPSIHAVCWQLPQLFTAGWVSRQREYKKSMLWLTGNERFPFVGLAIIAFLLPKMDVRLALALTFLMLVWQGLGAGFTANIWQSFIAKIFPSDTRGSLIGSQGALANIFMSIGAVLAGYLLDNIGYTNNFAVCFLLTMFFMAFGWLSLGLSCEPKDREKFVPEEKRNTWKDSLSILKRDRSFVWFLVARMLSYFSTMGFAFYIIYALKHFNMDVITAGYLTATLTISQTLANAVMGWLGDKVGHRLMLIIGALSLTLSALTAWLAPSLGWFYLVVILAGLANVSIWTIGMAMTIEYGNEAERPLYIGLSNTLPAPVTILAPIFGGWLADTVGYGTTFVTSAAGGVVTMAVLLLMVRDHPRN